MAIYLTDRAKIEVKRLQELTPEWRSKAIRVYLSGKGCDGFEYGVCFDDANHEDKQITIDQVLVLVDHETEKFVRGSTIDWIDDERGKGFVVENPNHKKFRGKFFRRKGWEERLLPKDDGLNG